MCPCKKWLERSSQPRGPGRMPLERVLVRPHRQMRTLIDTGFEVWNTSNGLRPLKAGRSS